MIVEYLLMKKTVIHNHKYRENKKSTALGEKADRNFKNAECSTLTNGVEWMRVTE